MPNPPLSVCPCVPPPPSPLHTTGATAKRHFHGCAVQHSVHATGCPPKCTTPRCVSRARLHAAAHRHGSTAHPAGHVGAEPPASRRMDPARRAAPMHRRKGDAIRTAPKDRLTRRRLPAAMRGRLTTVRTLSTAVEYRPMAAAASQLPHKKKVPNADWLKTVRPCLLPPGRKRPTSIHRRLDHRPSPTRFLRRPGPSSSPRSAPYPN